MYEKFLKEKPHARTSWLSFLDYALTAAGKALLKPSGKSFGSLVGLTRSAFEVMGR